ncbi:MAG: uncharacterized protein A8A55_2683, partial [Amphiamblys sp. WSBS2006]
METGTVQILKHKNILFVFRDINVFLLPERKYKHIRHNEDGYACLERKYLPKTANRDTEGVICIVCHGEAAPEDLVFPLCRQMHFVICEKCIKYMHGRTYKTDEIYEVGRTNKKDEIEVFCPYCKEGQQDSKTFQEEILDAIFSLIPHQTLPSLELRPDMEVETVAEITRETRVVLDNIAVTDVLFFELLAKTAVEIRNTVSLVGHDDTLDWRIGELDWRTKEPIIICFDEYTSQEMKQVYENIKTIPRKN